MALTPHARTPRALRPAADPPAATSPAAGRSFDLAPAVRRCAPGRRVGRAGALAVAGLLLASCAAPSGDPDPAPTRPPESPAAASAPQPTRSPLPDVPVQRAEPSFRPATVAPTELTIPSIDVTVPVEPVGVAEDGQMEIPPRAEIAGWYRFGSSPAHDAGTSVIAAHVDSALSGIGPFARLTEVRTGDEVEVELADGDLRTYRVTEVEQIGKTAIRWDDVFVRDGDHRLVLITCGGTFAAQAGSYTDNVIVTAVPVTTPTSD